MKDRKKVNLMKYGKIRQPSPRRTSRREEDYQQVQAFLDSGDQALWKALYEDAYETVRQCAAYTDFGHLLDPEEYREIADEAFARCYEQLERYQGRSRFSGWVGGYSKNITRTRCRQILTGMRYRRQLYERSTGRFMDWDPLWLLLRLERDACLWRAISETGWRILEARALEKLTFRDIARELQLTRREVQTRYEAVCTAVRRRYLRYCEERTL